MAHEGTTVGDLIQELQQHDPDMLVMVEGYEGGLTEVDLGRVHTQEVELGGNTDDYSGPHEQVVRRENKGGCFYSSKQGAWVEGSPDDVIYAVVIRR